MADIRTTWFIPPWNRMAVLIEGLAAPVRVVCSPSDAAASATLHQPGWQMADADWRWSGNWWGFQAAVRAAADFIA